MSLKNLVVYLLILCWNLTPSNAQVAEKIYGKNKVLKPNSYYLNQLELWKIETEKNPTNPDAWYNFYRASRNAYIKGEEDNSQHSKGKNRFERLQLIVNKMEVYVPDSYEYHYVKWLNSNNNPSQFNYLERAYQLMPNNPEPILSLIIYYEINGNFKKRNEFIEKYNTTGDYSPGLLNYAYNVLIGLDNNALILTEGDKDTEAILLAQGKAIRNDVQLINLNLLLIKSYRNRIFNELGIDSLNYDPLLNEQTFQHFQQTIIEHLVSNKNNRPVYTSLTVSKEYTNSIKNNYLIGLARKYSLQPINEIEILKENIEHKMLLDYLIEYFPTDISIGNVQSINGNYLIPFAQLFNYYKLQGNNNQAEFYISTAYKIAVLADIKNQFDLLFTTH